MKNWYEKDKDLKITLTSIIANSIQLLRYSDSYLFNESIPRYNCPISLYKSLNISINKIQEVTMV